MYGRRMQPEAASLSVHHVPWQRGKRINPTRDGLLI
jgi:hypothetical protein